MPEDTARRSFTADESTIYRILYRELYAYLTGKDGFAAKDYPGTRPLPATAIDLPRPLARGVVHFYSLLRSSRVCACDHALLDQIAVAVAGWFSAIWQDLRSSAPMETLLDSRLAGADPTIERFEELLSSAKHLWPGEQEQWERLHRLWRLARNDDHRRALCRRFVDIRRSAVHRQRDTRRERALRLVASPLADHLNDLLPHLQANQDRTRRIFGTGGVWRIIDQEPVEIAWEALEPAQAFLEQAPGLAELGRLLVRGSRLSVADRIPPEQTPPEKTVSETRGSSPGPVEKSADQAIQQHRNRRRVRYKTPHPAPAAGLAGALASGASLPASPVTEVLFDQKLREQACTGVSRRRSRIPAIPRHHAKQEKVYSVDRLGSLMVCIDTSGSMRGTPEMVARATVLSLVRESIRASRPVKVFLFSGELLLLEHVPVPPEVYPGKKAENESLALAGLSPPAVSEKVIMDLATLLSRSFTSGADITPAMEHALTTIELSDQTAPTEVVIVSDVRFPRLPPRHLNRIYNLQSRNSARFHYLTVNEDPMQDPLNVFDYRWFFDTRVHPSPDSREGTQLIGVDPLSMR